MKRKKHTRQQILEKLRTAGAESRQGRTLPGNWKETSRRCTAGATSTAG